MISIIYIRSRYITLKIRINTLINLERTERRKKNNAIENSNIILFFSCKESHLDSCNPVSDNFFCSTGSYLSRYKFDLVKGEILRETKRFLRHLVWPTCQTAWPTCQTAWPTCQTAQKCQRAWQKCKRLWH